MLSRLQGRENEGGDKCYIKKHQVIIDGGKLEQVDSSGNWEAE